MFDDCEIQSLRLSCVDRCKLYIDVTIGVWVNVFVVSGCIADVDNIDSTILNCKSLQRQDCHSVMLSADIHVLSMLVCSIL